MAKRIILPNINTLALASALATLLVVCALSVIITAICGLFTIAFFMLHYLFVLGICINQLYVTGNHTGQMFIAILTFGLLTIIACKQHPVDLAR